jgi:protein-S-isoprenylcysteine O-methyltransferase Ste14
VRVLEWIGSVPLLLLYGLAIAGQGLQLALGVSQPAGGTVDVWLLRLSQVATIAFLSMQFILILVRRRSERRAHGLLPVVVTLIGVSLPAFFIVIARPPEPPALRLASLAILAAGMSASTYVLLRLGRSFSILPQARGLVSDGPYARLRHPLYAAELVSSFGVMLQFAQPWSFALFVATTLALVPRMGFEEEVLLAAYPAYGDYMRRTWRLIPGLY